MENKGRLETLGEGFMVSKLSQIGNEFPEKGNSVNLNEKLGADDYCPEFEINHVEFASRFGSGGSVDESMVFDGIGGNNVMDNESLIDYCEDKLSVLTCGHDIGDNNVVALGKNLGFCGNDGVCIEKVDDPLNYCGDTLYSHDLVKLEKVDEFSDKGDHVLIPHKPGSPTKFEVSGNGVNLFVDVFGPLNGISENIEVDQKMEESESNQEYSLEENETLSSGIEEDSCKNEGQDIVVELECTFNSGDLVWVKTRNQSWWPGMVSQSKRGKRVSYLVKYYGNPSFVWCDSSDLKPFIEYFEQISGQNNSRNFCALVEKALCEIGQHVKSKVTCACFTKESQTHDAHEENSMLADKDKKIDALALSQLEPTTLCASIKNLACSVYAPGQIELTVLKNCLSSFYCSVGHRELPLELLSSDGDHNNMSADVGDVTRASRKKRNHSGLVLGDGAATSAKALESRERKKSKYLSYPYIDVIKERNVSSTVGQEKEDPKSPSSLNTNATPLSSCLNTNATPLSSCSVQKSRKKGTNKPLKHHVISKADNINASSSKLLAELLSTARDCSLEGSKYSNKLKRFYVSYRMFAFLDVDIACKEAAAKKQNSAKAVNKEGAEVVKKSKNKSVNLESVKESVENFGGSQSKEGVEVVKKSKNKRVNLASAKESEEKVGGSQSTNTDDPNAKGNVKKRAKKKKDQVANTQNQLEGIGGVKEAENQKLNSASTEGSVENAVGDKFLKTDNPQENVIHSKAEKTEGVIPAGSNIFHNSSGMINFQKACSNVPVSGTTPDKTEGLIPWGAYTNLVFGLLDLNRKHPSFSSTCIPVGEPSIKPVKPLPEQMVSTPVPPNITRPVSSPNDAPETLQNTPQASSSVNGLNQSFTATESGSNVTNTGLSPFAQYALKMGIFGSAGTSEPRKRKRRRKEEIAQSASAVPDLNGNVLDMNSSGNSMSEGSHISHEGEPPKKRVNKFDIGPDGEPLCGNVLLNFAPGSTLPSQETLVAAFSRFGLLKESEIQVLSDTSIQIVYERRSDALFAFRSLEKGHSFGESLVTFTTDCMPPPSTVKKKQILQNVKMLPTSAPVGVSKNQTKPTQTPNIAIMKKNVEMMKLTLEKSGYSLSPELKAKLENEIKVFLDKINSVAGSSST